MKRIQGGITAAAGFTAAGVACGIKTGKKDLAILLSEKPCVAAGVFTTNKVKAASLQVTRGRLRRGKPVRAVVVNSGNANCCTGERGLEDARRMTQVCGETLGIAAGEILVCSTGPIGKFLPMKNVEQGIRSASAGLRRSGARDASEAILTTDTVKKQVAIRETIGGEEVRIGAMAKGAGMIEPNMGTMLAFVTTDAAIDRRVLSDCLKAAVDNSFNRITVDGDRSTNDTVLVLANGLAGNRTIRAGRDRTLFEKGLETVCTTLAKMIVRDGEGATRFIAVTVKGAVSCREADTAARAVANSNLVKTALHGGKANWGRIMAALGYSGAKVNRDLVDIALCGVRVTAGGQPAKHDAGKLAKLLQRRDLEVVVDLKLGKSEQTVWTCDFSAEYVAINQ